jgi:glycosyltransferase involved in cell wall biosynthesis
MNAVPTIIHLVDDTTAGGVMRVIDFLTTDAGLNATATHEVVRVMRGQPCPPLERADAIVSHMALSWRALPALGALRALHPRKPMIHIEHSYTEGFTAHNVARRARFKTMLKLSFALFNRVVCVSNAQAVWMIKERLVTADKLNTIQSCVDLSAFRALEAPQGSVKVFGAIGRLEPQKGFDTLIRAFRRCATPHLALHVIGEGAQESRLRELAQGDSRIVFQGFRANPVRALDGIDVVVMPSRWEAYGLVAIEALAAGRKLVCAGVDGLRDHAPHGARLINTNYVGALSDALEQEVHAPPLRADSAAIRTSDRLEQNFREGWDFLLREAGVPLRAAHHPQSPQRTACSNEMIILS